MAITPAEARLATLNPTPGELVRVEELEKEIDERLADPRNHSVTNVYVSIVGGAAPRVKNELQRRYEAAGWVVTWHDDQRDGLSIQLQPRTSEPVQAVYGEKH